MRSTTTRCVVSLAMATTLVGCAPAEVPQGLDAPLPDVPDTSPASPDPSPSLPPSSTPTPSPTASPATSPDPSPSATASPTDDAIGTEPTDPESASPTPLPDDRLLLAGDLPYVLGMLGAERVEDPTGDVDGTPRPLPDVYGWSPTRCGQPAGEPTMPDPLDWRTRSFSRPVVEAGSDDLGADGSLAAFLVVEGIATVTDPGRIVDDQRRALRDCGPAATLPGALSTTGDTPPVVRVDAPDVGDDAVAWRSASLDPDGALVYDTVWWRRSDQLVAVTVGWSAGPLPGAAGGGDATATPTDADLLALLADAGEAESRAALALVARELDARL